MRRDLAALLRPVFVRLVSRTLAANAYLSPSARTIALGIVITNWLYLSRPYRFFET